MALLRLSYLDDSYAGVRYLPRVNKSPYSGLSVATLLIALRSRNPRQRHVPDPRISMSRPSPAQDDGAGNMDDDDHIDLSPEGEPPSSDEETVREEQGQDHIAEILEEERQREDTETAPPTRNPLSNNRYRQLLHDRDDASEAGSSEGLPRRVGSPIGSLQSVPDDTPSVQVGPNTPQLATPAFSDNFPRAPCYPLSPAALSPRLLCDPA